MKISLGCGRKLDPEFIGFDCFNYEWNERWVAPEPLPFQDGEVDFIKAENFIEHLTKDDAMKVFNNCWHILRKDGTMEWTFPDVTKNFDLAFADPTHRSFWCRGVFKYLDGTKPSNADYSILPWEIISAKDHPKNENICIVLMKPKK